jgi:hypothetical protein
MTTKTTAEARVHSIAQGWVDTIHRDSEARIKARENLEAAVFPHGRKASSASFDWHLATFAETFVFFSTEWDVTAAKKLIHDKPRTISTFRVEEAAPLLPDMPDESVRRTLRFHVELDWAKVEQGTDIDLSVPVIVATVGKNRFPIDGWHRIARGRYLWARELPCVVLTASETGRVRIG